MNYLTSKNRKELLLLIILMPIVGSLISKIFGFDFINWSSIAHLIALIWQFETILKLNRILKSEFSMTLTKMGFVLCVPMLLVNVYKIKPETIFNIMNTDYLTVFVLVGMAINLTYFYIIYILTRLYSRATTGHDPSGIELFPTYFYFLIYPIAIWKYQNELKELEEKSENTT